MTWNEKQSALRSHYNISRKTYCAADPTGAIQICQHTFTNRRRIDPTIKNLCINLFHLLNISNAAPDYSTAISCFYTNRSCKISSYKSTIIDFIKHVRNHNISVSKIIYDPLIEKAFPAFFFSLISYNICQIRANRHKSTSHCSSH